MPNDIANNRSALKDFLGSVATVSGDLSNITAPPFVLGENSTVEIPQYWADHPTLFTAQGSEESAEQRALSVLKYFIGTLRNQQYSGRKEKDGVKKPLNAFLGELFLGHWKNEEIGETRLVAEQVSHHPPVTCCYLWNDKHGVRAQGFTQQEITFSGNVNIKQKGYALLHLDRFDEDYLIPVPNIKVKGLLSGTPYPELAGAYSLISSNGYISHLSFTGKSFFGTGQKNGLEAKLYHADRPNETLYTVKGAWNGKLTFHDARSGEEVDTFDVNDLTSADIETEHLADQDPWESRKAWGEVISALHSGDMKRVADAKSRLEEGQRKMRADEEARGEQWKTTFFQRVDSDPVFDRLSDFDPGSSVVDAASGFWKIDREAIKNTKRPFHGDLLPTNERLGNSFRDWTTNRDSIQMDSRPNLSEIDSPTPKDASHGAPSPLKNVTNGAPEQDEEIASRREESDVEEQRRAQGISAPAVQEPTDIQVEAYLRSKTSNVVR
ncbi:Oxysterol-binding protein [Phaeosphaeriaceae sp. SRC1lsM3a]|nr:Oxysterol-binding protein [Stagonospora sp. SRC1lsM3a]